MVISAVPNEILLAIADHLEQRDIYSFLRVSRRLHALLADYLLLHNVRHHGGNALIWATTRGHSAIAHRLVELGADVDREIKVEGTEMIGPALLHIAAYGGNMPMTRLLLELGANAEQWDGHGRTPLYWALNCHRLTVTEELCYKTTDLPHALVNVSTRRTPLHLASEAGLFGFIIAFVQLGMDVSAKDSDGKTPLEQVKEKLRGGHWTYCLEKELLNDLMLTSVLIALGEEPSSATSFAEAVVKLQRWCLGEDSKDEIHEFSHVLYGDPSVPGDVKTFCRTMRRHSKPVLFENEREL